MLRRFWILLGSTFPSPLLAETGKSGYAPPAPIISPDSTLQMLGGLILVLALIGGISWLLKRFSLIPVGTAGAVKVIAATAVGQRERVVVVEIANTWLVLGVAPGRVSTLHTLDKTGVNTNDEAGNGKDASSAVEFSEQLSHSIHKNHG
ncbi:flagellar biosynthetic protein FliO [Nitrosomonas sp. JL21]|uniref:flagellar biosynthetic protein FliO n=1 Tax=Nitrosomonas sp. JL21 TaxID=153949 RepID=UPI0013704A6D|nr:flagellar biosynthetic protein FliO [Nitrosomonas sp. JL21]MBL8497191.1 flagellar biosynthetic protein FliO [Nitrosomonas sp.]MCC7092482.1 flagellar biosynthetic protein FliO [Nitrosomonas sp.]MXS76663.1 flagellar biosynthetic protein FliO [Nitrosomonas sp. JL21]